MPKALPLNISKSHLMAVLPMFTERALTINIPELKKTYLLTDAELRQLLEEVVRTCKFGINFTRAVQNYLDGGEAKFIM